MNSETRLKLKAYCVDISEAIDGCIYNIRRLMETAEYQSMSLTGRRKLTAAEKSFEKADNFIHEFIDCV